MEEMFRCLFLAVLHIFIYLYFRCMQSILFHFFRGGCVDQLYPTLNERLFSKDYEGRFSTSGVLNSGDNNRTVLAQPMQSSERWIYPSSTFHPGNL